MKLEVFIRVLSLPFGVPLKRVLLLYRFYVKVIPDDEQGFTPTGVAGVENKVTDDNGRRDDIIRLLDERMRRLFDGTKLLDKHYNTIRNTI